MTADTLLVSLALASCSPGFTARSTIVANTPKTAMTTRSSMRVKPFWRIDPDLIGVESLDESFLGSLFMYVLSKTE